MINENKHPNRLGMVALQSVILGVGILFAGCEKPPETITEPAIVVGTKAPLKEELADTTTEEQPEEVETEPLAKAVEPAETGETQVEETQDKSEEAWPTRIADESDIFTLHAMKQEYEKGEEQSEVIEQAFAGKWAALTKRMKPRTLIDGLDFLALDTKATGEKEYTFSFLLRSTADLDTNYHLTVLGFVFLPNAKYLPKNRRERLHVGWNRVLNGDPTSQWKQGENHVVHLKAKTERLIPYNLRMNLHTRTEQNRWANNVGANLALGWQWDILDEEVFLSEMEACDNFAELYALAPAGPRLSAPVAQALERKWKSLISGMTPQAMIEGLDFLALDTKATNNQEYTFTALLHATEDLTKNYHLAIGGVLDPRHKRLANPGKKYISWPLLLYDNPMSEWKSGEYHVAQLKAPIEWIVPLDMWISLEKRNARKRSEGGVGSVIGLGWRTDKIY